MNSLKEELCNQLDLENKIKFLSNFEAKDKEEVVTVGEIQELISIMRKVWRTKSD